MAMIKCPECNADVSDKAQNCTGCGAPMQQDAEQKQTVEKPSKKEKAKDNVIVVKQTSSSISTILVLIAIIAAIVFAVIVFTRCSSDDWFGSAISDIVPDIIPERTVYVDANMLEGEIQELSTLVTLEFRYRDAAVIEDERWFARARMIVQYSGRILLGVDFGGVSVELSGTEITVGIPQAHVISHEFGSDLNILDERGLFIRITLEDFDEFAEERRAYLENEIAQDGALDTAWENAQTQLEALLSNFLNALDPYEDYTVRFIAIP